MTRLIFVIVMSIMSINAFAKTDKYILFFYSANCSACHDMLPVLEGLSQNNKISIIANSIDQVIPNKFTESLHNLELFRAFRVHSFPVLIGVNLKTRNFVTICLGMTNGADVTRKVLEWYSA